MHDPTENPFASPQEAAVPDDVAGDAVLDDIVDDDGSAFRDNHYAVVRNGMALPQRCVHCNGTGSHPLSVRFLWRLAITDSQYMRTRYWVCNEHYRRHGMRNSLQVIAVLLSLGMVPLGFVLRLPMPLVLLLAIFVSVAAIAAVNRWCGSFVAAALADQGLIFLAGCSRRFLRSLPPRGRAREIVYQDVFD